MTSDSRPLLMDLRSLIAYLDEAGLLLRVARPVDPRFELNAVTRAVQRGPNKPLLFESVAACRYPVLTNVHGSIPVLARLLDCPGDSIAAHWARLIYESRSIDSAGSSGSERLLERTDVSLMDLPQTVFSEKDAGAYITAGIVVAKDPETGVPNLSYHRAQIVGEKELRCRLGTSGDLYRMHNKAERMGRDLPAAMLIGLPPAIMMAAATSIGRNEFDVATALAGARVPLMEAPGLGLEIPLATEFLIEGRILAGARRSEGPFGDWLEYYIPTTDNHVFEIDRVTAARDAIFYAISPASLEEFGLSSLPISGSIYRAVRQWVPTLQDVTALPYMQFCVMKLRKEYEGQPKKAMLAAFGAELTRLLYCVAVDEDVDIHDPRDWLWAIATRCRPDRDVLEIADVPSAGRDAHQTYWGRIGFDATKPLDAVEHFERKQVPGGDAIRLQDYLE